MDSVGDGRHVLISTPQEGGITWVIGRYQSYRTKDEEIKRGSERNGWRGGRLEQDREEG